jgi:hypothetical protein
VGVTTKTSERSRAAFRDPRATLAVGQAAAGSSRDGVIDRGPERAVLAERPCLRARDVPAVADLQKLFRSQGLTRFDTLRRGQ